MTQLRRHDLRKWHPGSTAFFTHFPKDRSCEVCLRTKMTRAHYRRRTGEAALRAEKFGDMITADQEVLGEEGESGNNHRHAVVVQDLATQWKQSCPRKTKTSQETEKSSKKVSRAVTQAKSYLYRQFIGIWQILWRSIVESSNSSIWNTWHCWKSGTQNKRRNFSRIATIRLGWKMVGWFCGMLLPSAKCSRPPGRRENSIWKPIRGTI